MRHKIFESPFTKCFVVGEFGPLVTEVPKTRATRNYSRNVLKDSLTGPYKDAFELAYLIEEYVDSSADTNITLEIEGHISNLYYFVKQIMWRDCLKKVLNITFFHRNRVYESELFIQYMSTFVKSIDSYKSVRIERTREVVSTLQLSSETRIANNSIFQNQFKFLDNNVNCINVEPIDGQYHIDFVIPTKSVSESDVSRCIDSILARKETLDCIYLIDDNEDENIFSEEFKKRYEDKISITKGRSQGIAEARNLGLSLGKNDLVCFIDSDDYVIADYVSVQREFHRNFANVAATGTWLRAFGLHEMIYPQWDNIAILGILKCLPPAGVLMWKRRAIEDLEGFEHKFAKGFEDYDLVAKACSRNYPISVLDEALYRYQRRESSLSNSLSAIEESTLYLKVLSRNLVNMKEYERELLLKLLKRFGKHYPQTPLDLLGKSASLNEPIDAFENFLNRNRNKKVSIIFRRLPRYFKLLAIRVSSHF